MDLNVYIIDPTKDLRPTSCVLSSGGKLYTIVGDGTDAFCYRSSDSGHTWEQVGASLTGTGSLPNAGAFISGGNLFAIWTDNLSDTGNVACFDIPTLAWQAPVTLSGVKNGLDFVLDISDTDKLLEFSTSTSPVDGNFNSFFCVRFTSGAFGTPFQVDTNVPGHWGQPGYAYDGSSTVTIYFVSAISEGIGFSIWKQSFNVSGSLGSFATVNDGTTDPTPWTDMTPILAGPLCPYLGAIDPSSRFALLDSGTDSLTADIDPSNPEPVVQTFFLASDGTSLHAAYEDDAGALNLGSAPIASRTDPSAWTWQRFTFGADTVSYLFNADYANLRFIGFGNAPDLTEGAAYITGGRILIFNDFE